MSGWTRLPDAAGAHGGQRRGSAGAAYVVGGFTAGGATTAAVERYDLRSGRRRRIAPMPLALNHAAAAAWRGRLYVVGGYTAGAGRGERRAAALRPARDRWTRLADMPTARGALTAGVVGDRLVRRRRRPRGRAACGRVEVYDLRRGAGARGPAMRIAREHLAGAVLGGAFYVLAGRTAGGRQPDRGRALRSRAAPLGAPAVLAPPARRHVRGGGGRIGRPGRRGGADARRQDDRRGGGIRSPQAPLARARRHANTAARAGRRRPGRLGLSRWPAGRRPAFRFRRPSSGSPSRADPGACGCAAGARAARASARQATVRRRDGRNYAAC